MGVYLMKSISFWKHLYSLKTFVSSHCQGKDNFVEMPIVSHFGWHKLVSFNLDMLRFCLYTADAVNIHQPDRYFISNFSCLVPNMEKYINLFRDRLYTKLWTESIFHDQIAQLENFVDLAQAASLEQTELGLHC